MKQTRFSHWRRPLALIFGLSAAACGPEAGDTAIGWDTDRSGLATADEAVVAPVYKRFYVSPTGIDSPSRGGQRPAEAFRTIAYARDRVRPFLVSMTGNIEVIIAGGSYLQNQTLVFNEGDSGQNGFKVVYRNAPGETPRVSGGRVLTAVWERVDATNNVWRTTTGFPNQRFRQIYVNNAQAQLARSPAVARDARVITDSNHPHYRSVRVSATGPLVWPSHHPVELVLWTFWYAVQVRLLDAVNGNDGYFYLYPEDWDAFFTGILRSRMATLDNLNFPSMSYFLRNSTAWLNEGSFYQGDPEPNNRIWYRAAPGVDMNQATVIVPNLVNVVRVNGVARRVQDLAFFGVVFEHSRYDLLRFHNYGGGQASNYIIRKPGGGPAELQRGVHPGAVVVQNAERVDFMRCRFVRLGGDGLELRGRVYTSRFVGNLFADIGGSGLSFFTVAASNPDNLQSWDIKWDEQVNGNIIANNSVTRIGNEFYGSVGIWGVHGKWNRIVSNSVWNVPYSGISLGWGWGGAPGSPQQGNVIRLNQVWDAVHTLADGAGIYTLEEQASGGPWLEVSHNVVRDIVRSPLASPKAPLSALYFDAGTNYVRAQHNVFNNIETPPAAPSFCTRGGAQISTLCPIIYDNSLVTAQEQAFVVANNSIDDLTSPLLQRAGAQSGFRQPWAAPPTYRQLDNVARYAVPTPTSEYSTHFLGDYAIDGDLSTTWASGNDGTAALKLDFRRPQQVRTVRIYARQDGFDQPGARKNIELRGTTGFDDAPYDVLGTRGDVPFAHKGVWVVNVDSTKKYRTLSVVKTDGQHFNAAEIEVISDDG